MSHCQPVPHVQSPKYDNKSQNNSLNTLRTEQTSENADVTLKSFICTGGEVEIADALHSAEESIILPLDQATANTYETEDVDIADGSITQTCSDHIEHPYYNPEIADAVQDSREVFKHSGGGDYNVTWKSFACDGGEVEILDVNTTEEETVYLPVERFDQHLQEDGVNATNLPDASLQHLEHKDHPYYHADVGVAATSQTTNDLDVSESRHSDLTFKSFSCTGGEVLVSDSTALADETIPVPALQSGMLSESYSYSADASLLIGCQDVQSTGHLDHPYCNVQNHLFMPDSNELSPVSSAAVEEPKHVSVIVCKSPTNGQEREKSTLSKNTGSDNSDGSRYSPVLCDASAHDDAPDAPFRNWPQETHKQIKSHLETSGIPAVTDSPALSFDVTLQSCSQSVNLGNKLPNCQTQQTLKEERPEFSPSSHLQVSSKAYTPVQVNLSSGPEQPIEEKDSALGFSGNGPITCNSAEKPAENLTDVLKVLSECRSMQFELLSPVIRRASLFLSGVMKVPPPDELLTDDSALEVEKSLLAPVDVNTTGLWAENMDMTMPQPLLNSTTLGCKLQPTEPAEDGGAVILKANQTRVEKPALDVPLIQDGPLQQQLRQMAEFLLLASGKIGPAGVTAQPQPPAVAAVPLARAPPAESCTVAIGTSPVRWANHSVNTSGQFERRREFSISDACTLTDPLLWK